MEIECFQCFVTSQYLTFMKGKFRPKVNLLYFTVIQDDYKCIDCGRTWLVPLSPKKTSKQATTSKLRQGAVPNVIMCPNDWCDYYQTSRDDGSDANLMKARHNLMRHKKTCDSKFIKGQVYIRSGKKGKYVDCSSKGKFRLLLSYYSH